MVSGTNRTRPAAPSSPRAEGGTERPSAFEPYAGTERRDPYRELLEDLEFLKSAASHYVSAQGDLMRTRLRKVAMLAVAWVLGRIVLYTALAYAVWMVLRGLSGALAELFDDRAWAGDLLTGVLFLSFVGAAAYAGTHHVFQKSRRRVAERYEHRRPRRGAVGATKGFEHGTGI